MKSFNEIAKQKHTTEHDVISRWEGTVTKAQHSFLLKHTKVPHEIINNASKETAAELIHGVGAVWKEPKNKRHKSILHELVAQLAKEFLDAQATT